MEFLGNLFEFTGDVVGFLVFTVFAKMILGKWIAEKILQWLQTKNGRNAAIWEHYNQAHPGDVEYCTQGKCIELQEMVTALPQTV